MTDRELLELAAKVAGILTPSWYGNASYIDGMLSRWNPLEDDGDALRLAAVLRLHILHNDQGEPVLWVSAVLNKRGIHGVVEFQDEEQRDAATRRAIVRAAAEIGAAANK